MNQINGTDMNKVKLLDFSANPAPLGLMGFGMTTVLLNLHNAGYYPMDAMILAMGIFYGGVAQIIAGLMEWKKGNTFGTTAFTSYGLFWLTLVGLIVIPKFGANFVGLTPTKTAFAAYLFTWGIFTLFMYVGTLKTTRSLQVVFLALAILFFLLAIGNFLENPMILKIAGFEGLFTGFAAIYTALGQVLNEMYEKKIVPL